MTPHRLALTAALSLLAWTAPSHAASDAQPYTPARDDQVVEVLRERPLDGDERRWQTLRQQARQRSDDLNLALDVARQAVQWARRDGDPRLLGQAQAALRHWWAQAAPPPDVRLLRATILQSTHEFDAALRDLQALTRSQPDNRQAWLTQASVQQVTGRYDDTLASCEGLGRAGATWHQRVCTLEVASYRGQADRAERELATLATQAPRELHPYINLVRAELAERQGHTATANGLYAVLLTQTDDAYTAGAYADCLLDQGRAAEVIPLLQGRQRNDALLLRLAEAYAATAHPGRDAAVETLRARFAAARERGDNVHRREEARFQLRLLKRPRQALQLALANWAVQKEPADARVLLEAAHAAGQPEAAAGARAFIAQTGWSDRRLAAWL